LIGPPAQNHFSLFELEISDIPQISQEENNILTSDFQDKEVNEAVMQMKKNKAPGLDGFFCRVLPKVIKHNLMNSFVSFQQRELPPFHLNCGNIILLPKKENAIQIQQYRPVTFECKLHNFHKGWYQPSH
jgi:hypothetical protein